MRFHADMLGRIRRGEITATVRPLYRQKLLDGWPQRSHSPHYAAGCLVPLQKIEDIRTEREGGVEYDRRVVPIDDHIEIVAPTLMFTTAIPHELVEACGFEALDDLIDYFRADYPGRRDRLCWVYEFRYIEDMLHYIDSKPSALDEDGPEQADADRGYTHRRTSQLGFVHGDDAPAIDHSTLNTFAEKNRERFNNERSAETQADELRNLGVRLKELQRRQRDKGIDCSLGIAKVKREIEDLERQMDEAA